MSYGSRDADIRRDYVLTNKNMFRMDTKVFKLEINNKFTLSKIEPEFLLWP